MKTNRKSLNKVRNMVKRITPPVTKYDQIDPPSGMGYLSGFRLLRVQLKEGQCPECAIVHEPHLPHNQQSLFWQYNFMEKNGRWPTWADALAHCSPEMRALWVKALAEHGVIVPDIKE